MSWQAIWTNIKDLSPGVAEISLRLLCAMVAGLLIGIDREHTHRPAGLRTHILVSLGACVISIVGEALFGQYSDLGALPDPARLSAQVVTGVGFLGAGTIMKRGATVKGLTTAASLWATACLGLTAGFGYYTLTLLGCGFILITLTLLKVVERHPFNYTSPYGKYSLETEDLAESLHHIHAVSQVHNVVLMGIESARTETGHKVTFRIRYSAKHNQKHRERFFAALSEQESTLTII